MRKAMADMLIVAWMVVAGVLGLFVWDALLEVLGTHLIAAPLGAIVTALLLFVSGPVRREGKGGRQLLRNAAVIAAGMIVGLTALLGYIKERFVERMPDMARVMAYDPAVTTVVRDRHKEVYCTFTTEHRVRVPIEQVHPRIIEALVAAEDERFYEHHGIDPIAMARAAFKNVAARLSGSGSTQGGSTLTQQVVKQVLLRNSERTVRRKIQETILAVEMERRLSKTEILEIYVNHVFMGHHAYGFEAAMRSYFGKSVNDPTLAEAAILAGLPQAPNRYARFDEKHYKASRARMTYVLDRMVETGKITRAERKAALAEEFVAIAASEPLNATSAPYVCDLARREVQEILKQRAVSDQGLQVETTIDMRMQRVADAAVRIGLRDLERRLGFAGAEGHDDRFDGVCSGPIAVLGDGAIGRAVVMSTGKRPIVCLRGTEYPLHAEDADRIKKWEEKGHAPLVPGDMLTVRIETIVEETVKGPKPKRYALPARRTGGADVARALQAAMVVVDPRDGELRALVGGFDFAENQYNNATQAERQVGSAFKPFVYLTGLMRGMTVADTFIDAPFCIGTASGPWCPTNYKSPNDDKDPYLGEVDPRTAMAKSLNSVSAQIGIRVGPDAIIDVVRDLGITRAKLDRVYPITLGSEDISLWEMTHAYAGIAAGGKRLPSRAGADRIGVFVTKIADRTGKVLYERAPEPREQWPQAVPATAAHLLIYLMKGVVDEGTGVRVKELGRPAMGKTGTTNGFKDAWFLGCTTDLCTGVWAGRQTPYPIGGNATGGSVALPMWLAFMKTAHPDTPITDFPPPPGIAYVPTPTAPFVPFQRGRIPENALIDARGLDEPL